MAGQSARQSAGAVTNEAAASSTAQVRQACDNAETLHETLDMMQQMIQQNTKVDERREARCTTEQKERETRRTVEQKERKATQAAKLAILGELKQKLAGVSKRMDGMETQQQAGAQTQLKQQDKLKTLADWHMQQEQALQQLGKEAADTQACVLKRIRTHEQDLQQDHRLEQDHQIQFAARMEMEVSAAKLGAPVLVLEEQYEQETSTKQSVSSTMQSVVKATATVRQELEQLKGEEHRLEQEQKIEFATRLELEQLTTKLEARVLLLEEQYEQGTAQQGNREPAGQPHSTDKKRAGKRHSNDFGVRKR